jgi:hypothetical protein
MLKKLISFYILFLTCGNNLYHPGLKGDFRCDFAGLSVGEERSAVVVVIGAGSKIDASLKIEEVVKIVGT